MKLYKIRNKSDPSLYRMGGIYERWNKTGKTWDTLGNLRSFISLIMNNSYHSFQLEKFEIVELEVQEVTIKEVHEIVVPEKLVKLLKL